MHKTAGIAAALLTLAAGIGGFGAARHFGLLSGPAPAQAASEPMVVAAAAPSPVAAPVAAVPVVAPPADPNADLPSIEIAPRVARPVPGDSESEPAPHVTIERRDGRVIAERSTPVPQRPPPRASQAALDPGAIAGPARPVSGPILSVDGRTVRLFGVRPADAREHCGPGGGVAASCILAANAAIAARLGGNAGVTCTMPPGQRGDPAFICRDASGLDLGGMLVAQGLALVDTGSSYQYMSAQDAARVAHQGLWRYR